MVAEKTYLAIDLEPSRDSLGGSSPLHITITPPVKLEEARLPQVASELKDTFRQTLAFAVVGGELDEFGPAFKSIRVRRVIPSTELLTVHNLAMDVMKRAAPDIDETYARQEYTPHSTPKDNVSLAEGEVTLVEYLILLRKLGTEWTRIAKIPLITTSDDETTA